MFLSYALLTHTETQQHLAGGVSGLLDLCAGVMDGSSGLSRDSRWLLRSHIVGAQSAGDVDGIHQPRMEVLLCEVATGACGRALWTQGLGQEAA